MRTIFRILVMSILVSINGTIMAQQCFDKNFKKGQTAFNKKQYKKAKLSYQAALDCPDANSASKKQAMSKIKECEELIKNGNGNTAKPEDKPEDKPDKPITEQPIQIDAEETPSGIFTINGQERKIKFEVFADGEYLYLDIKGCKYSSTISYSPEPPNWIVPGYESIDIKPAVSEEARSWTGTISCPPSENTIQVQIYQEGQPPAYPNANIKTRGYNASGKDVTVFSDIQFENMKGEEAQIYAWFYQEDGVSPLRNEEGTWVMKYVAYTPTSKDDFERIKIVFTQSEIIKNTSGNMVKYGIGISNDGGKTWLARLKENQYGEIPIIHRR